MPIIAPKQRVSAPAATPLPGGLFSQFAPIEDSSVRWENGVTWEDVERAQLGAIGQWQSPGAVPGLPKTLADPKCLTLESQAPLTVYAAYRTTALSHSPQEATQIAASRLLLQEEHAVEQALWSGAPSRGLGLGKVRSYAAKGAGKLDMSQGLAALEHYAAQYGARPTLHIPRRLASLMASAKLIKDARGADSRPASAPRSWSGRATRTRCRSWPPDRSSSTAGRPSPRPTAPAGSTRDRTTSRAWLSASTSSASTSGTRSGSPWTRVSRSLT